MAKELKVLATLHDLSREEVDAREKELRSMVDAWAGLTTEPSEEIIQQNEKQTPWIHGKPPGVKRKSKIRAFASAVRLKVVKKIAETKARRAAKKAEAKPRE